MLASVSVPLFDAGAAKSQVLAQEAALEQARASYQAVVLTALKDVQDALEALRGDRQRLIHLQSAASAASNAALMARHRYSSGLIDFQTVLQTQRSLLSTQDSVASTQLTSAPTMCVCTRRWAAAGTKDVARNNLPNFPRRIRARSFVASRLCGSAPHIASRILESNREAIPCHFLKPSANHFQKFTMTTQAAPSDPVSSNDLQTLLDEPAARVWWRRTWVWATVALVALCAAGI